MEFHSFGAATWNVLSPQLLVFDGGIMNKSCDADLREHYKPNYSTNLRVLLCILVRCNYGI